MKLEEILNDCLDTPSWGDLQEIKIDSINFYGNTPLHTVCTWGELPLVETLVEAGADVNFVGEHGNTPIYSAIVGESIDVVEYLIKKGARKNVKNEWGASPYSYASNVNANDKIIKLLRK